MDKVSQGTNIIPEVISGVRGPFVAAAFDLVSVQPRMGMITVHFQ